MTGPRITVVYGDAWELALTLERQSIDCIVTSPPYWSLRDYGHPDQFGLEKTPGEYVAKLVDLFARLRPALKDDGTLWLNLGDSYAGSWGAQSRGGPPSASSTLAGNGHIGGGPKLKSLSAVQIAAAPRLEAKTGSLTRTPGLKPKDLVGVPWRVAFALQEDGWYLRSDIIWHKPNPMPESVTDRPSKSHEYIFLLAKSEQYYYDQEAVRVAHGSDWIGRPPTVCLKENSDRGDAGSPATSGNESGRNIRTVWTIATQPYPGSHFAVFPSKLIEPCIKAGTSERGVCPECGRAWVRVISKETSFESGSGRAGRSAEEVNASGKWRLGGLAGNANLKLGPTVRSETLGWRATCPCGADPIPATVLDPFLGSGTTAQVARSLGRNCIGFELNEGYRPLIEQRLAQGVLL